MSRILERHPVSALLVIDLDNFKSVNDTLGHSGGDECLDLVVSTIGAVVGRKGIIYRWGSGDEFAVCLPDFSTEEAQATAERIRRGIEEAKPGGEITVTTSIGVCGSDRANSKSADEILDFADKAMYASKKSGRNRVTTWPIGVNLATDTIKSRSSETQQVRPPVLVTDDLSLVSQKGPVQDLPKHPSCPYEELDHCVVLVSAHKVRARQGPNVGAALNLCNSMIYSEFRKSRRDRQAAASTSHECHA